MSKVAGADGDGDDVAAAGRMAGETGIRHAALLWRRAVNCGRQGAPVALAACAAFLVNHPCFSILPMTVHARCVPVPPAAASVAWTQGT